MSRSDLNLLHLGQSARMHMLEYDSKRANVAEGEERMVEVGVGE